MSNQLYRGRFVKSLVAFISFSFCQLALGPDSLGQTSPGQGAKVDVLPSNPGQGAKNDKLPQVQGPSDGVFLLNTANTKLTRKGLRKILLYRGTAIVGAGKPAKLLSVCTRLGTVKIPTGAVALVHAGKDTLLVENLRSGSGGIAVLLSTTAFPAAKEHYVIVSPGQKLEAVGLPQVTQPTTPKPTPGASPQSSPAGDGTKGEAGLQFNRSNAGLTTMSKAADRYAAMKAELSQPSASPQSPQAAKGKGAGGREGKHRRAGQRIRYTTSVAPGGYQVSSLAGSALQFTGSALNALGKAADLAPWQYLYLRYLGSFPYLGGYMNYSGWYVPPGWDAYNWNSFSHDAYENWYQEDMSATETTEPISSSEDLNHDGIPDALESEDADGDGDDDDKDNDGVDDDLDPDDDNDGIPDSQDTDDDGDGIPDSKDTDNSDAADDDMGGEGDADDNGGDDGGDDGGGDGD